MESHDNNREEGLWSCTIMLYHTTIMEQNVLQWNIIGYYYVVNGGQKL